MVTAFSCKDNPTEEISLAATSKTDVSYGADPAQKMDYYLPAERSSGSTKAIVLIHGGAWVTGDKADFAAYIDTLRKRLPDYALFNINYRLATATKNPFPAQENDVKAALNFIYDKRSEFNISDKIVLLGASAGGHLALLQGYKYSSPVRPKAIINFFGPSDMADMFSNPSASVDPTLIAVLVGGTPANNQNAYYQSSPVNFINGQSPPTLTFQGGLDPLVLPSQQAALHARLQANGVVNEHVLYPNEAHGWYGINLTKSFDKIEAFLEATVK